MWISVIVYLITRAMVRRCGKRESFAIPLLYKNTIIHQDRLGTNKGRTQNKRRVFLLRFRHPDDLDYFPPLEQPAVIGGFLSFFLVFYASQAYNRFHEQYDISMSACGRIYDVACLAHAEMTKPAAKRLWRHCNLAHALAYTGLSEIYTVENFLKPLNQKYGLCSRAEWRRLEELKPGSGADPTREVITW